MARTYVVGRSREGKNASGAFSVYQRSMVGEVEVFEEDFPVGDADATSRVAEALNMQEEREQALVTPTQAPIIYGARGDVDPPVYGILNEEDLTVAPVSGGPDYNLDSGFSWVRWDGNDWTADL